MSAMSATLAPSSSSTMFPAGRRGSDKSWEELQPIPWEHDGPARTDAGPPQIMLWRASNLARMNGNAEASSSHSRSTSIMSVGIGYAAGASRSRVSMDALPAEDHLDDADSHATISPTSSSTSLPIMDESPPPPRATAIQPAHPVGLGLSSVTDEGRHELWPPSAAPNAVQLEAEVDSDDEEVQDQNEMDTYMASHRAPVDAALRSMPGVVGLGDGWAGGPAPKAKKRWFRRNKKDEPPTEADPLALWSMSEMPSTSDRPQLSPIVEGSINRPTATSPENKWWKSRRNLFSASQRVLHLQQPTSPPFAGPLASPVKEQPPPTPTSRHAWRSKLSFGSMVDLRRTTEPGPVSTTRCNSALETSPVVPKRHSVSTFLRKPPPHPLELSHSNGSTPSSRSQPMGLSASSSQPSLTSVHHHPMLRQPYARSESYLAGAVSDPNGASPAPPPLIHMGTFGSNATSMPPVWRPPMMSTPTPLLEVQEEDEEEHETSPESTDRPLQRTATFGDEEEYAAQKASAAPELSDISGSPQEGSRALSVSDTMSTQNGGHVNAAPVAVEAPAPPPQSKFMNRIKTALTLGRGRTRSAAPPSSYASSIMSAQSPRSFQSEQMPPKPNLTGSPLAGSIGRGSRRRSKLFTRRRGSADPVTSSPPVILAPASPVVPASLTPASPTPTPRNPRNTFGATPKIPIDRSSSVNGGLSGLGSGFGGSITSTFVTSRRTSWAAPIPYDDDDDDEITPKAEKRRSRVSLRAFKGQSKQRPPLGTVFPRPPTEMQAPPSLHWAFPAGSYSTPVLHKFGGSTLSLALDISADGNVPNGGLDDIAESPTRRTSVIENKPTLVAQRERALSATIAALTSRQTQYADSPERRPSAASVGTGSLRGHRTVPINMENLSTSNDSLTLPSCGVVDFPLPPSTESGDIPSPDPDHVEHLCTPHDGRTYPTLPLAYYRRQETVNGSIDDESLHKQPSWSTSKTSDETVRSGMTPLATPTSSTSDEPTHCSSYATLFTALEGCSDDDHMDSVPATCTPTPKRLSMVSTIRQQLVM